MFPGQFHVPMPAGLLATMCGWEVREVPGGLEIEFDPEDVRPRERLELEHVPLLVAADAKTKLTVEWTAAGLSAEGSVSGRFVVPVVDSTLQALTGEDLGKLGASGRRTGTGGTGRRGLTPDLAESYRLRTCHQPQARAVAWRVAGRSGRTQYGAAPPQSHRIHSPVPQRRPNPQSGGLVDPTASPSLRHWPLSTAAS